MKSNCVKVFRKFCFHIFNCNINVNFVEKNYPFLSIATVEKCRILEKLSENTLVFHQVHKRIWPSSQRDTVFVSHIRKLSKKEEGERLKNEIENAWMVTNWASEHQDAPVCFYMRHLQEAKFYESRESLV